jgi:transcriptional regulator GlxA family with amidase domain
VGQPPKTLQAILRFQRLRACLAAPSATPPALARAAAECGYFDQAHLSRDCARLAGATPAALASAVTSATAARAASAMAGRAR